MAPTSELLHVSSPTPRSLLQTYRVFSDRLELECKFVPGGLLVIPREEIVRVEYRPRLVVADVLRGATTLREMTRTLKLDLADLYPHMWIVTRGRGWFQHVRFVPDDAATFASACAQMMDTDAA